MPDKFAFTFSRIHDVSIHFAGDNESALLKLRQKRRSLFPIHLTAQELDSKLTLFAVRQVLVKFARIQRHHISFFASSGGFARMETVVEQIQSPTMLGQRLTDTALPSAPRGDCYSEFACGRLLCQTEFLAFCFELVHVRFSHKNNISHEYPGD